MATTIANNDYVIINESNLVISLFTGKDLPEYNEEMINVIDVTTVTPKPQLNWAYDKINHKFTAPVVPEEVVEEEPVPTELDLLKQELKNQTSFINYMDTEFQTSGYTILIINSYISLLHVNGSLPENFFWLDKFNNKVPMTVEQFKTFADLVITNYFTQFTNYVDQKQML